MADPTKDLQQMLSTLLEASRRDAQIMDMVNAIKQALVDAVAMLEKGAKEPPDATVVNVAAPIVNVSPEMKSDWTSLEIDAPVDGLGRPTGKMTIKKVK
jgi:hypothetical protein